MTFLSYKIHVFILFQNMLICGHLMNYNDKIYTEFFIPNSQCIWTCPWKAKYFLNKGYKQ